MKISKFNKLSGTEIRVKKQVNFYLSLICWIKNFQEMSKEKCLNDVWNEEFLNWAKREGFYNYSKNEKINRFEMICSFLKKINIKKNEFGFFLNIPENISNINENYLLNQIANSYKPFGDLLKFFLSFNKEEKLDFKKMAYAFFVYDENKDSYSDLYKKENLLDIISEKMTEECLKNNEFCKFKKKPNNFLLFEKIYYAKKENCYIDDNTFLGYDFTSFLKYLRPHELVKKKYKNISFNELIKIINEMTFKELLLNFIKNKNYFLLQKDYYDLFSRWLFEFGLTESWGIKTKIIFSHKIKKKGKLYFLEELNNIEVFPFDEKTVINNLLLIQKKDFSFKYKNDDICNTPNSALSEYFVNLHYAYKYELTLEEFKSFCNTKMSKQLFPIFTAPGKMSDMLIIKNNEIISIESTILKNKRLILNNEVFPCVQHIKHYNNGRKLILIFVSFVNKEEYFEEFSLVFNSKIKNGTLLITNFELLEIA